MTRTPRASLVGPAFDSRVRRTGLLVCALAVAAVAIGAAAASADPWPTFRHDAARSGITTDKLSPSLSECWVFQPRHGPEPAWGDPKSKPIEGYLELRRQHFDDAFQVVTDGGGVYFGSSADNKVYCLDAATGAVRWTRITGGPIRLAPTLAGGRVFVGSDDGYVYCLDAKDGTVIWKFRAAPEDRRALGHGKMISLWPLRTGVLVDDGVVYVGAGIFPAEGVFLYALDAETGKEVWRNETCGETPQSRISPQGYLLASKSTLYAPMGRVSPAAFDRRDGKLKHFTYFGKSVGGTYALLAGEHVYTGTEDMVAYHQETRDRFAIFDGRKLVVADQTAYVATEKDLSALDRTTFPAASRKVFSLKTQRTNLGRTLRTARSQRDESEAQQKEYARLIDQAARLDDELEQARKEFAATTRWSVPTKCHHSLILAGNVLVAGGTGEVVTVAAESGEVLWTAKVDGVAKGLASVAGRLWVSTDKGGIYCFGPTGRVRHGTVTESTVEDPFAHSPSGPLLRRAAETILEETGIQRGFCLVLGCETGQLALELAKRSELTVYAVDADADKVAAARKAIDAAGFHGSRVCVEQWPADEIPYSEYSANLIVSETALVGGELPNPGEVARLLKPCGGTVFVGQPDAPTGALGAGLPTTPKNAGKVKPLGAAALEAWVRGLGLETAEMVSDRGTWAKLVRGPLPGAGSWTHQYANPANTACGDDEAVRCPLGLLWFGDPGPGDMVNRHRRAAAPLSIDGRIFVQGENVVMAYDIYNGLKLWQREIPGALRANASHDGSNLAVNREGLFVAIGDTCVQLDPASGETTRTYRLPPADDGKSRRWGYVATVGDLLFGSRGRAPISSQGLFAIDLDSGKTRWQYDGKRISHNSIAIGDGRIYFVDTDVTAQQRDAVIDQQRERIGELPDEERARAEGELAEIDVRLVVALDAETGEVCFKQPLDLTHCGGGSLAAMYSEGVLALFGVYLDGHYWREFFAGEFDARRVTALSGADGKLLWSHAVGFRVRPLIIGDTLHAEPWAFDLHTGEPRTRVHPVTGETGRWQFARSGHHCGCPAASPNCLFFRSYCLGYYDLVNDSGTMHFGTQRPGCWINFIPTGGLLVLPEASVGCMCPFPNMCTVVFSPTAKGKGFAQYSAEGEVTPVRRLAINLGAPGDRLDAAGKHWFGFPRPFQGRLVLDFKIETSFYRGGSFVQRNSTYTPVAGTKDPWLFASTAVGLKKCVIPLLGESDGTASYRVRLALADPDNDQPGRRVFDVKLQDRVVLEDLDVAGSAGGRDRALFKEFGGIKVDGDLVVELVAKSSAPSLDQAPVLQAIEIVREKIVSLGCAVPSFLMSNKESRKTGELRLTNLRDEPFAGTIRITAPDGFAVAAERVKIELASGARLAVALKAAVAKSVPPGDYPFSVALVRSDGSVEIERTASIEHLGPRGRVVIPAIEDASVSLRYPETNRGSVPVVLVDGGNRTMGDEHHSVAYLRFALDVPGKALSVRFRIHDAGNPSGDAGRICLASGPWSESMITYNTRPEVGRELARFGRVSENQVVECPLEIDLEGKTEITLVLDPTSCDGIDFLTRESGKPPELIIEYEPTISAGSTRQPELPPL